MVNNEILGGIESALVRGQSLKQAMISFYNAGYEKAEIEEAARHSQQAQAFLSRETAQEKPTPQTQAVLKPVGKQPTKTQVVETKQPIKTQPPKQPLKTKQPVKKIPKRLERQNLRKQVVSAYGDELKKETSEIKHMLSETMKGLRKIKETPKIIPVYNKPVPKPPVIVQRVSGYGAQTPKPINKAVTFLLVFLLIFLLGALVAVFFFKQELVDLFNRLSIS